MSGPGPEAERPRRHQPLKESGHRREGHTMPRLEQREVSCITSFRALSLPGFTGKALPDPAARLMPPTRASLPLPVARWLFHLRDGLHGHVERLQLRLPLCRLLRLAPLLVERYDVLGRLAQKDSTHRDDAGLALLHPL